MLIGSGRFPVSEIWKACPGYDGYEVSTLGRVRSPDQILSTAPGSHGYPQVQLRRGNVRTVHSLVLEAFVGPRPEGMEACHDDGDKLNAKLINLRWDTPGANGQDKSRHGTAKAGAQKAADTRRKQTKDLGMHSMDDMTRAGCTSRRGIRHWEDLGLLGLVGRSAGDTRQYTNEQLDRARIIAAAQFGGWPLDEIKEMLDEYHAGVEVYDALTIRLSDQMRAAVRLVEALPVPLAARPKPAVVEYDL